MRWAVLMLACTAAGQEFSRETILLARIKAHADEELKRVPNYTCLETVARFRKDLRSWVRPERVLHPLDLVQLEIVYTDHHEWYGSPGDRKLGEKNPAAFIGGGMIGNGAFAGILNNIVAGAACTYRGEETVRGRRAVRYDFRLRRDQKSLSISLPGGEGTVGQKGSLWADPQSLDLIRIESRISDIPVFLPLIRGATDVNYARMRIGEYNVLMAQDADSDLVTADGVESFNRMDFTHCRAYSAQSEIRYDVAPGETETPVAAGSAKAEEPRAVPAFLTVPMKLKTPVTDRDAVGALIEAQVADDVLNKKAVAIPKGSVVRGRIRRLERFRGGSWFIVGLEFTEIDVRGQAMPFYADVVRLQKDKRIQAVLKERVVVPRGPGDVTEQRVTLPDLAGVASFYVQGASFALASGFEMVWRTRGMIVGVDRR